MIDETYSPAFLGPRTAYADQRLAASWHSLVRVWAKEIAKSSLRLGTRYRAVAQAAWKDEDGLPTFAFPDGTLLCESDSDRSGDSVRIRPDAVYGNEQESPSLLGKSDGFPAVGINGRIPSVVLVADLDGDFILREGHVDIETTKSELADWLQSDLAKSLGQVALPRRGSRIVLPGARTGDHGFLALGSTSESAPNPLGLRDIPVRSSRPGGLTTLVRGSLRNTQELHPPTDWFRIWQAHTIGNVLGGHPLVPVQSKQIFFAKSANAGGMCVPSFGMTSPGLDVVGHDTSIPGNEPTLIHSIVLLCKAVVKTPMKNGHVDYGAVPPGSSIWVTVKDEHSSLHGRPILIVKRPDGNFALEGGSGYSHWHDDPEREKKVAARRHLVLATKAPADEKAEAGKAKDEQKVAARNDERATARTARDDAARQTREAVGIPGEQRIGRKERDKITETGAQKLQEHGLSPEEASDAAKYLPSAVQEARGRAVAHHVAARVDAAHNATGGRLARTDDHQPAQEQRSAGFRDRPDDLPSHGSAQIAVSHGPVADAVKRAKAAKGGALSAPEMEQAVKGAVHDQVDNTLRPDDGEDAVESQGDLPVADIPAWEPRSEDEATSAVQTFQREAEARGFKAGDTPADKVAQEGQQTVKAKSIDRSLVDAEGLSDTAFDQLLDHYRQTAATPQVSGFYAALAEHWKTPQDYARSLAGHVSRGAAAGWQDLARLGVSSGGMDVGKLVDFLGVEAAAHVLAAHALNEKGDPTGLDTLVKTLTRDNASKIASVEQDTLARHAQLKPDARALETALDDDFGEDDEARAAHLGAGGMRQRAERQRLYAENISAQRRVLGEGLGNMQFRATFLNALERFGKAAKAGTGSVGVPVRLTFGDDEAAADAAMHAFRAGQGAIQKLHDTRDGWTLQVDGTRLARFADKTRQRDTVAASQQAIQDDDRPTGDFRVPGQADTVPDGQGGQARVAWTPMQRNDMEFLHKGQGGVLAGSRGGGKRLATLGHLARQIADNPRFKGIVTTDEGGADVWAKLAKDRFPEMRITTVPPDAAGSWVDSALGDMPHWPNGVLVLGHHQMSQRAKDTVGRLIDAGHIQAHVLDNPPTEGWGRSRHLTDHAHELALLSQESGVQHVALTDHHPVDQPALATQLASWTHPHEFGGADHRRAAEAAKLGTKDASSDSAVERQVMPALRARVAAEKYERPGPPPEEPRKARQRIAKEERQAEKPPASAEADPDRREWRSELERAVGTGNDGEAKAILDMAHHYGWGRDEAWDLYGKLTGEGDGDAQADAVEREQIENSPYFSVFHHFNRSGRLKMVNPSTGKKLLGRDERSGKLGQSTAEPWEMAGSGYDSVASEALLSFEGGHSQKYGMDAGDFWRNATAAKQRYTELLRRAGKGAPRAASQAATAVGGGAAARRKIAVMLARRPDKEVEGDVPTGPANTPVGMLPGTPGMEFGGSQYTPITMQPEDAAGGNVVPTNKPRPALAAPQPAATPPPFRLEMQYGGLGQGQTQALKEEAAGQQRLGVDVPQVRARQGKPVRKSGLLVLLGRR